MHGMNGCHPHTQMMKIAVYLTSATLIAAPSYAAEYRHGDEFTFPRGTSLCQAPGSKEEPPEACDTEREPQVVRLWGDPREGYCLVVRWDAIPSKPGYWIAVWKAWVDCKDLIPLAR